MVNAQDLANISQQTQQEKFLKQAIENEVALGVHILDVDARTFISGSLIYVPVFEEVIDPKTKLVTGKTDKILGYRVEKISTPFKEPFTTDITKANLEIEDIDLGMEMLEVIATCKKYADKYDCHQNMAEFANFTTDLLNALMVTSRGKNFRGAILAKSTINVHEATSKEWINRFDEEAENGGQQKKPFWKFW
jgi:hypothetical protein